MLTHRNRQPAPGPLCAAFAPLLAALDDLTDARLAEGTRAHLAECAWCRAQRATYNQFDVALRLHFAPGAMPLLSENLAATLLGDAFSDAISDSRGDAATLAPPDTGSSSDGDYEDTDDDYALQITVTPLPMPARTPRRSWRLATGMTSLAAVLVFSLLGGLLFLSHERLTPPASPRATAHTTATIATAGSMGLTAIGMSSATDGWAFSEGGVHTTAFHYMNGQWVKTQADINGPIEVVKMLRPDDGWAIGYKVYHYEGTHWLEMNEHLPDFANAYFDAISVVSPADIWLAGAYYDNQALILHYDGHTWTPQRISALADVIADTPMVNITGIAMVSASEGWAVGTATQNVDCSNSHNNNCGVNVNTTGIVLHYVNGVWQVALTLPNYDLSSISMVSASDGWFGGQKQVRNATFPAIGSTWNKPTLWHYGGSHWVEVAPPRSTAGEADPVGRITGITMFSASNSWLFASLFDQPQTSVGAVSLAPDVFHLEAGRWVEIETPVFKNRIGVTMRQVAFVSPNEFWGVGESMLPVPPGSSYAAVVPLLIHYKSGVWTVVES
jgi:hypothetical protein